MSCYVSYIAIKIVQLCSVLYYTHICVCVDYYVFSFKMLCLILLKTLALYKSCTYLLTYFVVSVSIKRDQ